MDTYPLAHDELAAAIGEALVAREAKVAVAETTAGGLISARMLSVAGASRWFDRGFVVYTGRAKVDNLGVDAGLLREHGSVSVAAVEAMAEAARATAGTAYGLAESGMAGPQDGRRSAKPVGSAVIAVATPTGTRSEERVFPGSRTEVMTQIAQRALELLHESLA